MRIWMPYVEAGSGSDVFTQRLAGALAEFGMEAVLEAFPKRLEYCPWSLKLAPTPRGISAIIANSWNAVGFARHGVPLISVMHLCVHDPLYGPYRSRAQALFHEQIVRRAERQGFAKADIAVAVSEATRLATIDAFPGMFDPILSTATAGAQPNGQKKIIAIPNGIDTSFFTPDESVRPDLKTLLFVGNPTRRKGLDLLIPIVEALGPDYRLDVIQGREAAESLSNHPQVRLLGRMDHAGVRDAMRRAGMLLFPTRLEGLPLCAIEAMATGLPVAALRQSSLPEVVTDGEDGILVPDMDGLLGTPWIGNHKFSKAEIETLKSTTAIKIVLTKGNENPVLPVVHQMADRIKAVLENEPLAMAMRVKARRKAAAKFSEQRMALDYALLLREAVNARVDGRPIDLSAIKATLNPNLALGQAA